MTHCLINLYKELLSELIKYQKGTKLPVMVQYDSEEYEDWGDKRIGDVDDGDDDGEDAVLMMMRMMLKMMMMI